MQAITFKYDTSPLRDAVEQHANDVKQYELEEFSRDNSLYNEIFGALTYDWMATVNITIFSIAIVIILISPLVYAVARMPASSKPVATNYMFDTATVGLEALCFNVVVWFIFLVISVAIGNDTEDKVPHPDYEQALSSTIVANRDDINEAVRLAAASQHIDLERACANGKYTLPRATGAPTTPHRTDTERLVQCGGDTFGALLYADVDGMTFQSVSTSTGADTFTVIAATGDTAQNEAVMYSSVQFPGVSKTKYAPYSQGEKFAWEVDVPHTADADKPFDDENEMTLDEARREHRR